MFYCKPGRPDQKGSCEVNHEMIRRILPKGTSFDKLNQEIDEHCDKLKERIEFFDKN